MKKNRYSSLAIALHWVMALVIFLSLLGGGILYFDLIEAESFLFRFYQWHKSLGVTAMALLFVRLLWRLSHTPPSNDSFDKTQLKAAQWGHYCLYGFLALVPFTGWLMVSSSDKGIPTIVFDLFKFPHLPVSQSKDITNFAHEAHFYLALVLAILIIGHIVMVFRHSRDGINILERISIKRGSQALLGGLALALVSMLFSGNTKEPKLATAVEHKTNLLRFSGVHANKPFTGEFSEWQLETDYQEMSTQFKQFKLMIAANSANTGNPFYDETLKEQDWLDVKKHPLIIFEAASIKKQNGNEFLVTGELTIKGKNYPLAISISQTSGGVFSTLSLPRLELDVGTSADPDAEWVDDTIKIEAFWKATK